jgi:hypothetical protein
MSLDLSEATRRVADRFESEGAAWMDDSSGDHLARIAVAVAAPIIEKQIEEQVARGQALVATIVQANADDAARTTNLLFEYEKTNAVKLAAALLALDAAIEACPVIDRRLLQAQDRLAPVMDLAEHYVAEESA